MSTIKVIADRDEIVAIADAVRSKTGTTDEMTLGGIVSGINGITPNIQSISITSNGTYTAPSGIDGYSPITVNVASSGGSGGIIDAPDDTGSTFTGTITSNGMFGGYYVDTSYNAATIELGVTSKTISVPGNTFVIIEAASTTDITCQNCELVAALATMVDFTLVLLPTADNFTVNM